jgi:hypothetical protein
VKLRHAAALALIGWYLMVPPIVDGRAVIAAPVSKWVVNTPFDSASECDKAQANLVLRAKRDLQKSVSTDSAVAVSFTQAQCIASDDPRLKPNEISPLHFSH